MIALSDILPDRLRERTRILQSKDSDPHGGFVLYWMQTALRVHDNPALSVAIRIANRLGLPVLAYHELSDADRHANDRHHTFVLEGVRDLQSQFAHLDHIPIRFASHVIRRSQPESYLQTLAARAAWVVTEDMPVDPMRNRMAWLDENCGTPILAVDTACIVPMQVVGKAFTRAFAFRNAARKEFAKRLGHIEDHPVPEITSDTIELPFNPLDLSATTITDVVAECKIDHSVGPVLDTIGGTAAGLARWNAFKKRGLIGYASKRNDALVDGVSRMSAYFHYGMVSPRVVAGECSLLDHAGAEKYLDELLIWRELAYSFCAYRQDHDRISALPDWAMETLAKGESDQRPTILSWERMARGQSGQPLWDAAQKSLLIHGELHNNVRMTWGKAILNWCNDTKSALERAIDLNHRYALDGSDPASFGGILWCFGQFDRPFPPARPIFGTVRGRPIATHEQRLDAAAYLEKTTRPLRDPMPSVAIIGAGLAGLMCARTLTDHGFPVTVFEKSRGTGGRMSTRRVTLGNDSAELRFDHGAQYFTVRDPRFLRYVGSWLEDGVVAKWNGQVVEVRAGKVTGEKQTKPRYVAIPGMNAIAKHLALDLNVRCNTKIAPLTRQDNDWHLQSEEGEKLGEFDIVVSTAPLAQTRRLLEACPQVVEHMPANTMRGCWALMLAFPQSLDLDFDAAFVHDSPISWIACNSAKPERKASPETWVIHASSDWSQKHMEFESDVVQHKLTRAFWAAIGREAQPDCQYATAHRWRYAIADNEPMIGSYFDPDLRAGFCGDWCTYPRIEGAFLSGLSAAGRVMGSLKMTRPSEFSDDK